MENNNQQIISLLTEINENLKLVLKECKKTHKTPNLLDIFGGMNNNDDAGFTDVINQSVKQVLTSSYHSGEILQRRLVLGLV